MDFSGQQPSLERLKRNDLNFLLIYDLLEAFHTDKSPKKAIYNALKRCLQKAENIFPPRAYQELIYSKIKYYNYMRDHCISIAPTLTMTNEEYKKLGHDEAVASVLGHIRRENWGRFIAKPVYGQESIDATFFQPTQQTRLKKYLSRCMQKYPGRGMYGERRYNNRFQQFGVG